MTKTDWAVGRAAFITGATSGFGEAVARRIHKAGGKVIVTGRRRERLEALCEELGSERIHMAAFDIRDRHALEKALTDLPAAFSTVDILINNAGLALGFDPAQSAKIDNWRTMIATNVTALAEVTHAVLPGLVERGCGHIVNLSSVASSYPYPGGNVYGATKAFVRQFSLNLRADLIGTPIRVTSIEPGMCDTEFSVVRWGGDAKSAAATYTGMQALKAEDIADAIEWALTRPAHVNINTLEVMPVAQAFAPFVVHREIEDEPCDLL